jgi:hypothetical protein
VSGRSLSFAFLTPTSTGMSVAEEKEVTILSSDGITTAGSFTYVYLPESPRLISVVPLKIPTTQPPITTVKFSGQFFSDFGLSATICDIAVAPVCSYNPTTEAISCEFTMPECNDLGAGVLTVDADGLDAPLVWDFPSSDPRYLQFVTPPLQVLIRDDPLGISHAAFKKVATTLPTGVVLYAWSRETSFAAIVEQVTCGGIAFDSVTTVGLGADEAALVGLDDAFWLKIVATSPNFGADGTTGLVGCEVSLLEDDAVYSFSLDFLKAPTIRFVDPPVVFTSGGETLTVSLSNFLSVTRTDQLAFTIDGTSELVRAIAGNSAEFLLTIRPLSRWRAHTPSRYRPLPMRTCRTSPLTWTAHR